MNDSYIYSNLLAGFNNLLDCGLGCIYLDPIFIIFL